MKEAESYEKRPDRAGRSGVVAYLPKDVAKRIRILAIHRETSVQTITEEAVMDWMRKYDPDFFTESQRQENTPKVARLSTPKSGADATGDADTVSAGIKRTRR